MDASGLAQPNMEKATGQEESAYQQQPRTEDRNWMIGRRSKHLAITSTYNHDVPLILH